MSERPLEQEQGPPQKDVRCEQSPTETQGNQSSVGLGKTIDTVIGPVKVIPECHAQAVCVLGRRCWEAGHCLRDDHGCAECGMPHGTVLGPNTEHADECPNA